MQQISSAEVHMEAARVLQDSFVQDVVSEIAAQDRAVEAGEPPAGCFFVGEGRFRKAERFDAEELDL